MQPPENNANPAAPAARLVERAFRHESGKLIAALTRILGVHNVDFAEEIVQDVLLKALQTWPYRMPTGDPSAWLMKAAKNKAIDVIRREQRRQRFAAAYEDARQSEQTLAARVNQLLGEDAIADDPLRMMFVCCHPILNAEARIVVTLNLLGGLTAGEIASTFLTSEDTMQKRLYRARQKLKTADIPFELPPADQLADRLDSVLAVLYLMFNEGYQTSRGPSPVRKDLCFEAMRLAALLGERAQFQAPRVFALTALMYFHTARLPARLDDHGDLTLLRDQDRALWSQSLIRRGFASLERARATDQLSRYHLEAGIAAEHCRATSFAATDWQSIKIHYRLLMDLQPSPFVALNHAIAVYYADGPEAALPLLNQLEKSERLKGYCPLSATLGEIYADLDQPRRAAAYFRQAQAQTDSPAEQKIIQDKLNALASYEIECADPAKCRIETT